MRTHHRHRASKPICGGLLLALIGSASCSPDEPTAKDTTGRGASARTASRRVFIVGIDGATWDVFDTVISLGVMPNLGRLCSEGAGGVLKSIDPTASPIVWTSIATGKSPEKHGIRGFVAEAANGRIVPVNSTMRRTKAIWNIAGDAGLSVGVLSWWVTWPAERVNGFLCSDYTWPLKKSDKGFAAGVDPRIDRDFRTYPPELIRQLEPFIKTESRVTHAELQRLGISALPRVGGYAVREILLKDLSVGDMATYLLRRERPDFFAVYFDGFDAYCHLFWPIYRDYLAALAEGEEAAARLRPEVRIAGDAMNLHLARIDKCLGVVMDAAGPDDVVIVVSDHGYGDNPGRKPIRRTYDEWVRKPHWHTIDGIIVARGRPIRQDDARMEASVLDITPTILALFGLPVADDMDGRVLASMLEPTFLEQTPIRTVPTYDEALRQGAPMESPFDEQMLERLRSLGYVD